MNYHEHDCDECDKCAKAREEAEAAAYLEWATSQDGIRFLARKAELHGRFMAQGVNPLESFARAGVQTLAEDMLRDVLAYNP